MKTSDIINDYTMPWFVTNLNIYVVLIISFCVQSFQQQPAPSTPLPVTYHVYWNSSNQIFNLNNNHHIINVRVQDAVNIYCPYYAASPNGPEPTVTTSGLEYYVIYQVAQHQYRSCDLNPTDAGNNNIKRLIVNCSDPSGNRNSIATIFIEAFSSIPGKDSFEAGNSYYFITTSSGEANGLSQDHHGACKKNNMKMRIDVCCPPDSRTAECENHEVQFTCSTSQTTPSQPATDRPLDRTTPRPTVTTHRTLATSGRTPTLISDKPTIKTETDPTVVGTGEPHTNSTDRTHIHKLTVYFVSMVTLLFLIRQKQ